MPIGLDFQLFPVGVFLNIVSLDVQLNCYHFPSVVRAVQFVPSSNVVDSNADKSVVIHVSFSSPSLMNFAY